MSFQPNIASNDKSTSSDGSDTSDHGVAPSIDNDYTNAKAEVRKATKGEDRGVFWSRLVVKVTKIIVAVTLTAVTYRQLKSAETNEFLSAFEGYCDILQSYTEKEFAAQSVALEGLSDLFLSYALASAPEGDEVSWPYVTAPFEQYEKHARRVISHPHDGIVWIAPIVTDVSSWNKYSSDVLSGSDIHMSTNMFAYENDGARLIYGTGLFTPIHQIYPNPEFDNSMNVSIVNYDASSDPHLNASSTLALNLDQVVLSEVLHSMLIRDAYPDIFDATEPISMLTYPIHSTYEETSAIVGYAQNIFTWKSFFSKFDGVTQPIFFKVENTCGDSFTFLIDDHNATYIDSEYSTESWIHDLSVTFAIGMTYDNITLEEANEAGICMYSLTVYPTIEFRQSHDLHATLYSVAVGLTMAFMLSTFFAYDYFVTRRNNKMIKSAVQSSAIVASMFPSNVRARLYKEQEEVEARRKQHGKLTSYLHDGDTGLSGSPNNKPLADLFTETTVLFADIAGFTAWSSMRQPCQVFILLETLYGAFDAIAKRRQIFKIETIGDCYVAVSGVPEPRADHAVAMCKFANDILTTMQKLTRQMESSLGPDTGDLALRVGLHSGPVTAGVLRGERARFQLFGDTMNTAARMEQTGTKNRIQISQTTADCLYVGGKSHWLTLRDEKVVAKGKGELVTYWLEVKSEIGGEKSAQTSETDSEPINPDGIAEKTHDSAIKAEKLDRLIDWNADILCQLLQKIISNRACTISSSKRKDKCDGTDSVELFTTSATKPFDEVKDIISLPQAKNNNSDPAVTTITVSVEVTNQLREYVSCIAKLYKDNEFHSFEHASHVMMSVTKLLSRIVAPHDSINDNSSDFTPMQLDHTYGIKSDPLTQFACVFSALIHDVDHEGVPNEQLINENSELAMRYDGKSIAEQNSIDLAWEVLMRDEFKELLGTICTTNSELVRFRQIVVNAVMATDLMNHDLKKIRDKRWATAFRDDEPQSSLESTLSQQEMFEQVNRKATAVIEHMIQASDVSHTMQHWHIYRKWNERLYFECYNAYINGRSVIDPTDAWYQGELHFFDSFVIPLATKLKKCGVFGVSGAEYLQYAMNNRSEWQSRGQISVNLMKDHAIEKYGMKSS